MEDQREGLPLLLTDLRVALLLLSEARYQALHRAFGISRDQANIVTLIALATVAADLHQKLQGVTQPPSREEVANLWLGTAVVRELLSEVAGPAARQTPFSSDLLLLVALVVGTKPVLRALNRLQPGRRMLRGFHRRYGHHVRAAREFLSPSTAGAAAAVSPSTAGAAAAASPPNGAAAASVPAP